MACEKLTDYTVSAVRRLTPRSGTIALHVDHDEPPAIIACLYG